MGEFGSEASQADKEFKSKEPEKRPGAFVRGVKKVARAGALIVAGWSGEQALTPDLAMAKDSHHVQKSEVEKVREARIKDLNKWVADFHIKTLEVRQAEEAGSPTTERVDLFLKKIKMAILDSGGTVTPKPGNTEVKVTQGGAEFNEKSFKREITYIIDHGTYFNVIPSARAGSSKEKEHKAKEEKPEKLETHEIDGIKIEYGPGAREAMEQAGMHFSGSVLVLADSNRIDLKHWKDVKSVIIFSEGKNISLTVHHGRGEVLTEKIENGKFAGTINQGKEKK